MTSNNSPVLVQGLEHNKISHVEAAFSSAAIDTKGRLFLWGRCVTGDILLPY